MSIATMGLALASVLGYAVAQALLKYGMDRVGGLSAPGNAFLPSMYRVLTEPFILAGFGLILLTVPMWLQVLSRLPLSIAYPFLSLSFAITLIIGALLLKESVTPARIGGTLLIILGVVLISRS